MSKKAKKERGPENFASPPSRAGGKGSTLLLIGALLLGAAAVLVNTVRIPGLTYAADSGKSKTDKAAGTGSVGSPVSKDLASKEAELSKKESDLQAREVQLQDQEKQVSSMLKDLLVQQTEQGAIRRVANMYAEMPPYKAGPLVQALDPAVAISVLRILSEDQAAVIVAYMDPAKGSKLMNELAKVPPAPKTGN